MAHDGNCCSTLTETNVLLNRDFSFPGVEVGKPTHFTVFTKGAGKAKLDVHFASVAKGEVVRDFEIIDNHDYSYTVKYTAVQQVRWTFPFLFSSILPLRLSNRIP